MALQPEILKQIDAVLENIGIFGRARNMMIIVTSQTTRLLRSLYLRSVVSSAGFAMKALMVRT
jgi:hypothetical protein